MQRLDHNMPRERKRQMVLFSEEVAFTRPQGMFFEEVPVIIQRTTGSKPNPAIAAKEYVTLPECAARTGEARALR